MYRTDVRSRDAYVVGARRGRPHHQETVRVPGSRTARTGFTSALPDESLACAAQLSLDQRLQNAPAAQQARRDLVERRCIDPAVLAPHAKGAA
jgi:hypothetical protein